MGKVLAFNADNSPLKLIPEELTHNLYNVKTIALLF